MIDESIQLHSDFSSPLAQNLIVITNLVQFPLSSIYSTGSLSEL
jgi:hypothetical protein